MSVQMKSRGKEKKATKGRTDEATRAWKGGRRSDETTRRRGRGGGAATKDDRRVRKLSRRFVGSSFRRAAVRGARPRKNAPPGGGARCARFAGRSGSAEAHHAEDEDEEGDGFDDAEWHQLVAETMKNVLFGTAITSLW